MTRETTFLIGAADQECRYPVLIAGQEIGRIYRWHGAWYAVAAGQGKATRVADGSTGKGRSAEYLASMYEAGEITARSTAASDATAIAVTGPVPLLHPRMRATPRNIEAANTAMAGLAEFLWTPLGGYPGADNPWFVRCQLCGWEGPRYWSHIRGRNGNPPSPYRHVGCVDADKVRARISAYQK